MKKTIIIIKNKLIHTDFLTNSCSPAHTLVITCWRSFIQMLIILMAAQYSQYSHYNGLLYRLLYRLHSHWYLWTGSNYMLIISHRDVNHTNTGTFSTKHANIYENCWRRKKRNVFCAKRSLSYAPSDDRCVTACVTRRREGAPEFK